MKCRAGSTRVCLGVAGVAGMLLLGMGAFAQTPVKASLRAGTKVEQLAVVHRSEYIPIQPLGQPSIAEPHAGAKAAIAAADPLAGNEAKLLELANVLKAAVDKSNANTLAVDVVRTAADIQKLAKVTKERLKLTRSTN